MKRAAKLLACGIAAGLIAKALPIEAGAQQVIAGALLGSVLAAALSIRGWL